MTEIPSHKNSQNAINSEGETYSPYAGVMKRGLAAYFDIMLLTIPYMFLLSYFSPTSLVRPQDSEALRQYQDFTHSLPVILFSQIAFFIYFTLQYRSRYQATPGMRLVDIKLTSEDFKKPSWASLTLRYALYVMPTLALLFSQKANLIDPNNTTLNISFSAITALVLILMIALTKHKQTYYDMVAKTVVLQKPKKPDSPFVYASLRQRFSSNFLDTLIIIVLLTLVTFALFKILPPDTASSFFAFPVYCLSLTTVFLIPFAYSASQYCSKHQATLGMRINKIKIMTTDHQKPSVKQLFLRYIIAIATFPFTLFNILTACMIFSTDRKQAHYDKMSKVIFVETSK